MMPFTVTHGRTLLAVCIWLAALTPCLFWALDPSADGTAVRFAAAFGKELRALAWATLGIGVIGLLVYPPFVPGLRLWWRRQRARWTVDKAPLQQALARLEHFENSEDHFVVAQIAHHGGELERAIPHALRALELEPRLLKARALVGRILLELRRDPEAAQQLSQVVARDESFGFGDALLRLATALTRSGRLDEAVQALERHAIVAGPDRRALLLRGKLANRLGDRDAAREFLRQAAAPVPAGQSIPLEQMLARAHARFALFKRWLGR